MMDRLAARAEAIGAQRAAAVRADVAALLSAEVQGVDVSVVGDDVVIAGRGLRWRAVRDPALRWIGSLLR
ncbi:hypothetical protein ACFOKI_05545 [Sphingomonas qilianensis]|uniref:Uncharacterized protein n=1 Tax=Sphingomonas qilianensis TaxID=1736690 RepID=A0ABU9XU12_9SPHN